MKNLTLFLTLGILGLFGTITPVSAEIENQADADSAVEPAIESLESETVEEEVVYDPALDTDGDGELSEAEIEAAAASEAGEEAPAE